MSSCNGDAPKDAQSQSEAAGEDVSRDENVANRKMTSQQTIDAFWAKFTTKNPGKATTIIPTNIYSKQLTGNTVGANSSPDDAKTAKTPSAAETIAYARPVNSSYETAAILCRAKVEKIIKECRRVNKKYRDPYFDIEADLKLKARDCLESLSNDVEKGSRPGASLKPEGVKRVTEIFDEPKLYIDGPTANDVRQGRDGDCWLMSALCTLSNKRGMIEKVCVAHDQDVGVYGFVFYRDGEWISEVVDDFLYLTKSDYDESYMDRVLFDQLQRSNTEELYQKVYQSNSGALYFAQCADPQETWLPLLEKCYAKAHGDFACIEGGFGGEGIEDLTGGITSEIFTTDILDKERFWQELLASNKEFLFSCATGLWGSKWGDRSGIVELHSYSVQKAVEVDGKRLVRLKNPWGKGEWKGPWSDGSKEWTPEWLQKLDHRFGDDGDFWIEYKDLLRKYQSFERTRLFEGDWSVAQTWTTLNVPWMPVYHDAFFSFQVTQSGRVVIVLSQLDTRYFRGLEGQYSFQLSFRVHKAGHEDYVVRSQLHHRLRRSISVELDLEAGDYDIRIKIDTYRDHDVLPVEKVIRNNARDNRDKLTRIALAYDLAHSKGAVVETAEEQAAKKVHEENLEKNNKLEIWKEWIRKKESSHYIHLKELERSRIRGRKKREARKEKLAAAKAAAKAAKEARAAKKSRNLQPAGTTGSEIENQATDGDAKQVDTPGVEHEATNGQSHEHNESVNPTTDDAEVDEKVIPPKEKDDGPEPETEPEPEPAPEKEQDSDAICESEEEDDLDSPDSLDSLSVYSDREYDVRIGMIIESMEGQAEDEDSDGDDSDEFAKDPWNAVAVVGLRVYHQSAESKEFDKTVVSVRVVRPNPYASDDKATEAKDAESNKTKGLDVDDSSKDATLVGELTDRKKSIMGNNRIPERRRG